MSQEIVVRLRDDYDHSLDDTVATREFSFDNVDYEVELSDENQALMKAAIQQWIDVARKRKARRRSRKTKPVVESASNGHQVPRTSSEWSVEIREWATRHGYDWDNKDVRDGVRIWAERTLGRRCRVGIIPRDVMEAHYKHKLQHKGFQTAES